MLAAVCQVESVRRVVPNRNEVRLSIRLAGAVEGAQRCALLAFAAGTALMHVGRARCPIAVVHILAAKR